MSKHAAILPSLKPHGTIGIVSPSKWAEPEGIAKGAQFLQKRGYQTVIHPQNFLKDGPLAGSDADRADAIMDMFRDPSIDAIICVRGGMGAVRIVDQLDYRLIKRHPKPFIGFSDITLLLQAINEWCGFVTYHGPMLWNYTRPHDHRTEDDCFAALDGKTKIHKRRFSGITCARAGKAEGHLIGGNLLLLQSLIDTPYDFSGQGAILFIEEIDEPLYKIERALCHLRLAGKFKGVRAVLVGEMVDISDDQTGYVRPDEKPYARNLRQIFTENLPPQIPLCFDFPCGHGKYLTTLPVGARVKLALNARSASLEW